MVANCACRAGSIASTCRLLMPSCPGSASAVRRPGASITFRPGAVFHRPRPVLPSVTSPAPPLPRSAARSTSTWSASCAPARAPSAPYCGRAEPSSAGSSLRSTRLARGRAAGPSGWPVRRCAAAFAIMVRPTHYSRSPASPIKAWPARSASRLTSAAACLSHALTASSAVAR